MARAKHCPENERVKRRYLQWLKDAKGYSTASVDMAAAAISRFEDYNGHRNLKAFHIEQARAFKCHLSGKVTGIRSGKPLGRATVASTLRQLKAFFLWLADQPGYRSSIRYSDAEYFTPSGRDERIASATRDKPCPELHEVEAALRAMPHTTETEKRDRAIFALTVLTIARVSAVNTLKIKHVHLKEGYVFQDAREVETKRDKTITTQFFPVGDIFLTVVRDWIDFLTFEKGFGPDDPLFPASQVQLRGPGVAPVVSLSRRHRASTTPIRDIFKAAFNAAGLPYYNPHSLRKTVTLLVMQHCRTAEEMKCCSQNMGHTDAMTTLLSYGQVSEHRQRQVIADLGERISKTATLGRSNNDDAPDPATVVKVLAHLQKTIT